MVTPIDRPKTKRNTFLSLAISPICAYKKQIGKKPKALIRRYFFKGILLYPHMIQMLSERIGMPRVSNIAKLPKLLKIVFDVTHLFCFDNT